MTMVELQERQIKQILASETADREIDRPAQADKPRKVIAIKTFVKPAPVKPVLAKLPLERQEHEAAAADNVLVTAVPSTDTYTQYFEPKIPASEKLPPPIINPAATEQAVPTIADQKPETVHSEELLSEGDATAIIDTIEATNWSHEQILFDDEILATYADLKVLLGAEEETSPSADDQIYETLVQDAMIILNPEANVPVETNLFTVLIAAEGRPEVVLDIESVIAGANDQPLEETLVQLSFSLAETSQDSAQSSIESALKDIMEILAQQGDTDSATAEIKPAITPELTQKLLILLRAVGYENPREVLVDFSSEHSLEFLLQAIQYLYQLLNDKNRPELSPKPSVNLSSLQTDDSLSTRLGKVIVHYFFLYRIVLVSQ